MAVWMQISFVDWKKTEARGRRWQHRQAWRLDMRRNSPQDYGKSHLDQTKGHEHDMSPSYDRYGMDSEDWRHLDEYWRMTYGNEYPRESERNQYAPLAGSAMRHDTHSDERIVDDINEHLRRYLMIDATNIEVTAAGGEVTLRGTVSRGEAKRLAGDVVESVSGVKNVRNEIRVQRQHYHPDDKGGKRAA